MGVLLVNGRIIDGTGRVVEKGYVVIEGENITEVGADFKGRTSGYDRVIDLSGCSLLPGLIDCHVHLTADAGPDPVSQVRGDSEAMATIRSVVNARKTLEAGFTTVRDCGAQSYLIIDVRRAIERGIIPGPRIMSAGMALCMTGGHGWWCSKEIDGADSARRAARENLKAGADFIKLIATGGIMTEGVTVGAPQLDEEEMAAAVREAKKAGKKAAAHAHGPEGVKNAVRAGVDSIEHGFLMDDEAISLIKERGTFFVPTVATVHLVVEKGLQAGIPEYVVRKSEQVIPHQERAFKEAHRMGLKMAMGTDAGMPFNHHGENQRELTAMVNLGLSPMEAIVSATSSAAQLLGLDEKLGSIAPGKLADLLVVEGDPLEDIALLEKKERIRMVMKGGKEVVDKYAPER